MGAMYHTDARGAGKQLSNGRKLQTDRHTEMSTCSPSPLALGRAGGVDIYPFVSLPVAGLGELEGAARRACDPRPRFDVSSGVRAPGL